jgi:hypothetical protein
VELRSEHTIESTLKRLGTKLPAIFESSAIEIFVPIERRDLDTFELKTGNFIFARSPNFTALLKLRKVTGVVGLVTFGDTNRPTHAIPIEDAFVQAQIVEAQRQFDHRADGIEADTFVRIIDGEMRDLCGTVRIVLKTKDIILETPTRNLLNLSHVPKELRVFYYSPLVEALPGTSESFMIREDINRSDDPLYIEDGLTVLPVKKTGRQQTITARIKRLIQNGTIKPILIATEVIQALKNEELRPPKTLSILHGIIRERLIDDYFLKLDPTIHNYRDVVSRFGAEWRFSLQDIAHLAHDLRIPIKTISNEEAL